MEKTFNLTQYITKTANMSYEGSQGYFLAQQRAWMNCSKCKRLDGKSANDAWQECFDEFQKGDRKLSWIANYAKADLSNISKESAVDYSEDIAKFASSGMVIGAAVTAALQQKIAWPSWMGGQSKPTIAPKTNTPQSNNDAQLSTVAPNAPATPKSQNTTPQAVDPGKLKTINYTVRILSQMKQLIHNGEYDTGYIRRLIMQIPIKKVQTYFQKYLQYLTDTEKKFDSQIRQMVSDVDAILNNYNNPRKTSNQFESEMGQAADSKSSRAVKMAQLTAIPKTPEQWLTYIRYSTVPSVRIMAQQMPEDVKRNPQIAAAYKQKTGYDLSSQHQSPGLVGTTNKVASANNPYELYVLRRYDQDNEVWWYLGPDGEDSNLGSALKFTRDEARVKAQTLSINGQYYIAVKADEGDWSTL